MLLKAMSYQGMADFLIKNEKEAKTLYIEKDFTARQLAQHFNIKYNGNFQKACFRILGDKGKGLGGARYGAGNSKENKERKKEILPVITFSVSTHIDEILKSLPGNNKQKISRALLYYHKVINQLNTMNKIYIIIEKSKDMFSAYAENVNGIYGGGDTIEEVERSIQEAIRLFKEHNPDEIPDILKVDYELVYKHEY